MFHLSETHENKQINVNIIAKELGVSDISIICVGIATTVEIKATLESKRCSVNKYQKTNMDIKTKGVKINRENANKSIPASK
ncbi:hypothetical protein MTHERMMSTA1_25340 [Methanosarcina thermophila MST-A1]|uniref:Uncharacterized protein n=1 Tax=Methanosarcina thermophila TaxID=2210 RepID=A0A3G9CQB2_METTE|nr:conserved hypothetical protein [Methanosarcina thermophila]BAW30192.1 conserved hypothetical protein [Methanosarcina thermophila]GLI15408.1 hypothetical protein MTHERMMSTA1_25340 [Methanosarcina thermophila MST-A1]